MNGTDRERATAADTARIVPALGFGFGRPVTPERKVQLDDMIAGEVAFMASREEYRRY